MNIRAHRIFSGLLLLVLVSVAVWSTKNLYENLNLSAHERRDTLVHLGSTALNAQLDHFVDIGISLASRVQFRQHIAQDNWAAAVAILSHVPTDFPTIERVFLADMDGVLRADYPALPTVRGRSFAERDWYQGVIKHNAPYVSEVYTRSAEPQYNVVAVAIPIKTDTGAALGILVLQLKLDAFLAWSTSIDVGPEGAMYVTDQHGHIVAHPKYPSQGTIIDISSTSPVALTLSGAQGVDVFTSNGQSELSAYMPVARYGWAVVATQPTRTAFSERNTQIAHAIAGWLLVLSITILLLFFVDRSQVALQAQHSLEQAFLESVNEGIFVIDRTYHIRLWNEASQRFTGWKAHDVLGQSIEDVLQPLDRNHPNTSHFIRDAMTLEQTFRTSTATSFTMKNGTRIDIEGSAAPMLDRLGNVTGVVVVFRTV